MRSPSAAEGTPFEDAAAARVFRSCFWPVHVWRREAQRSRVQREQLASRVSEGLRRLTAFRTWRGLAAERRAVHDIVTGEVGVRLMRRRLLWRALRPWAARAARWRTCKDVSLSLSYASIRARVVLALPFAVLRHYSRLRSTVRHRSFAHLNLDAIDQPPPLVLPAVLCRADEYVASAHARHGAAPDGRPGGVRPSGFGVLRSGVLARRVIGGVDVAELLLRVVRKALRDDAIQLKVNRMRRRRLSPLVFAALVANIHWRRRKRWALLRGWRAVYARVLGRWVMYVCMGVGRAEEAAEEAEAEAELAAAEEAVASRAVGGAPGPARHRLSTRPLGVANRRASQVRMMSRTHGALLMRRHGFVAPGVPGGGGGSRQGDTAAAAVAQAAHAASRRRGSTSDVLSIGAATSGTLARAGSVADVLARGGGLGGRGLGGTWGPRYSRESASAVDRRVMGHVDAKRRWEAAAALRGAVHGQRAWGEADTDGEGSDAEEAWTDERCEAHVAAVDGERAALGTERAALEARRCKLERWSAALTRRQRGLLGRMESVAEAASAVGAGVEARASLVLGAATDSLVWRMEHRDEILGRVCARVMAQLDASHTWRVARSCLIALATPIRWKMATRLSNRWRLKRYIRTCRRLNAIYRHMPAHVRMRTLRACFWGWLYLTADSIEAMPPGFARALGVRRERISLFSRLLLADRHPLCPRCQFARWLEFSQRRVFRRAVVACMLRVADARLLGICFGALRDHVGSGAGRRGGHGERGGGGGSPFDSPANLRQLSSPVGLRSVGGGSAPMQRRLGRSVLVGGAASPALIARASAGLGEACVGGRAEAVALVELERWTRLLRPEPHSFYMRRRAEWVERRQQRLLLSQREHITAFASELSARIAQERRLHMDAASAPGARLEPSLPGALKLREFQLRELWRGCCSLTTALMYSRGSELPGWAEPLARPLVAFGVGYWMFNALSFGLPKLADPDERVPRPALPEREWDVLMYWENWDNLLHRSAAAARDARVRHASPPRDGTGD